MRKEVSQLLTSLLARLTALERYEDFLQRVNTEAALGEPNTAVSFQKKLRYLVSYLSVHMFDVISVVFCSLQCRQFVPALQYWLSS